MEVGAFSKIYGVPVFAVRLGILVHNVLIFLHVKFIRFALNDAFQTNIFKYNHTLTYLDYLWNEISFDNIPSSISIFVKEPVFISKQ